MRRLHPSAAVYLWALFLGAFNNAGELPKIDQPVNVAKLQTVLESNCRDCHQGMQAEAGFDLHELTASLEDSQQFERWVQIFDRIESGEMPPPADAEPLSPEVRRQFLSETGNWLVKFQAARQQAIGRVQARRLTNLQLERTLQDLLGIDIPLEREMPELPKSDSFSTLAERQSFSHFQMEQHLNVVDLALDEAFRRALTPSDYRLDELSAKRLSRTRTRTREPEFIDGAAVIWSSTLSFYGRIPATTAAEDGWYRFRFQVSSLKKPERHGVWCTVRSGQCVSSAPLMSWVDSFEADDVPREVVVEAWLPAGHMLEIRPADTTLKMARFQGGQSANGEGGRQNVPGIKIDWMSKERIHMGPGDDQIRKWLLGDLEIPESRSTKSMKRESKDEIFASATEFFRDDPESGLASGRELLSRFANRAFRRPATAEQLQPFYALFEASLDASGNWIESLRSGYRAILCSPRFMYFYERPGKLDDHAIASRLSYLLWNSMPDAELLELAAEEQLSELEAINKQVARMLETPRGSRFVEDFASEWLELSEIDFTEPDRRLHPDFDIIVQYAMLDETHHFLQEMFEQNLSIRQLVDCDYTYANSRLARFYELDGIVGARLRRVEVGSMRGGLLGQGAILKVTANGTNTSPVLRGVWVSRRILGHDIPPPPDNVPAIEPDIRGAKSIREQLEKHRSQVQCAACHSKIDAPGFALENFDAAGKWRTHYPQRTGKKIKAGSAIDPSYVTDTGEAFADIAEFRQLVASNPKPIARNLAKQLLIYGTGANISFADRSEVERIVERSAASDYGVRSILEAVVASDIFRNK